MKISVKTVATFLFIGSVVCYLISGLLLKEGFFHDSFLHLATELLVLFLASFFIEPLLDSYHQKTKDNEWKGGKETAIKD